MRSSTLSPAGTLIHYEIDATARRVSVRLAGVTSGPEISEAVRAILADAAFEDDFSALVDLSDLAGTPSVAELRDVAATIKESARPTGARRAIVTDSRVFFSLGELFTTFTAGAGSTYRMFLDREDAEAWLLSSGRGETRGAFKL